MYAQTQAYFLLSFKMTYQYTYQEKLSKATPLLEGIPQYVYLKNEYQEKFFSFFPWWAGYENRTMIFYANVIFNNIFFYMQANDFPNFYLTDWRDKNDMIALRPQDTDYSLNNCYFVRARPDFALYDLISKR